MLGDGGGGALALAADGECPEAVNAAGELEVAAGGGAGGHAHGGGKGFEARVGGDELVLAGGDLGQDVPTGVVGARGESQCGQAHGCAGQQVARRRVADDATNGAGGGRRSGGDRGPGGEGEEE